jgi:hypothetical protein
MGAGGGGAAGAGIVIVGAFAAGGPRPVPGAGAGLRLWTTRCPAGPCVRRAVRGAGAGEGAADGFTGAAARADLLARSRCASPGACEPGADGTRGAAACPSDAGGAVSEWFRCTAYAPTAATTASIRPIRRGR